MLTSLAALAIVLAPPEPIPIKPSDTDPAITQFNDPHLIYLNPEAKKRNELLIFLPGTNGKPGGTNLFCQTAADLGYNVLALAYPTDIPATTARNSEDPNAFENFRLEIIEGRDLWSGIEVSQTDSIENRLTKALQYLSRTRPTENWNQFLDAKSNLNWSKIAVSGHSQGGGHAALIATKHKVARVVMTGAPKDFDRAKKAPAAWYKKRATPPSAFFAFNHMLDRQGCDYSEQLLNLEELGLNAFGEPAVVDKLKPPYNHSRMLFTNFEGSSTDSRQAHSTVIGDRITPKDESGNPVFRSVWIYMLTKSTKPSK